jgi:hypothetical protein
MNNSPRAPIVATTDITSSEQHTPPVHPRKQKGKLLQTLGVGFGIAVAVGNAISAGIVRTLGDIAEALMATFSSCGLSGFLRAGQRISAGLN